jgi:Tfp pilus assembly protein PilF
MKVLAGFTAAAAVLLTAALPAPVAGQSDDTDRQATIARMKQCRLFLKSANEYLGEGDFDSALIVLDSVLACDPKNPDAFYRKGEIFLAKGDTASAESAYAAGVSKAPLSARLKLSLARLKLAGGKDEEAAGLVDDVLAINPRSGEALYLKGITLLNAGDSAQAITQFQIALKQSLDRDSR